MKECAIERHARIQQRREFLRKEQHVAASIAAERRQLERDALLLFLTYIDRR